MDGTVDGGAWLALRDAARALGVSEKTVRRRVKAGQLRGRQVPTQHGPAWEAWVPGGVDAAGRVAGGGTQAATMLELVRLVGELQAKAEAAAMWQARAEVLALQLEQAHARLALAAPTEGPQWPVEARQAPEQPDPPFRARTAAGARPRAVPTQAGRERAVVAALVGRPGRLARLTRIASRVERMTTAAASSALDSAASRPTLGTRSAAPAGIKGTTRD